MVKLKCEICGGKLKLIDGFGHATCEYCGTTTTLPDVNDKQREFEKILLNARKAVDDKNWANVEKYYNLLQEEFPKDIIIEATFFSDVAKVIRNNVNSHSNVDELYKSFDVIAKYYDLSSENKEETLKKISEFLFKMTFPTDRFSLISYDIQFYNVIVVFKDKLEKLATIHNEPYIYSLISKQREIIEKIEAENERKRKDIEIKNEQRRKAYEAYKTEKEKKKDDNRKKIKYFARTIWYVWIAITIILTIHDRVKGVAQGGAIVDLFVIFVFGILPGLIIKGIIKLVKKFYS